MTSYFLNFASGARLELMRRSDIAPCHGDPEAQSLGYVHLALATGSPEHVDRLTARLRNAGFRVLYSPRRTDDGYYESVILDPDGNQVEITV